MRGKLQDLLAQLRFHGMAVALDAEIERAEREATPASELLYRLLCEEAASRRQRSLAYRLGDRHADDLYSGQVTFLGSPHFVSQKDGGGNG